MGDFDGKGPMDVGGGRWSPGQRCVSESEPELGLGSVLRLESGFVDVLFGGAETTRRYAVESAPLHRVEYQAGDKIATRGGEAFVVQSIRESDGLLVYSGEGYSVPETELSDSMGAAAPEQRLLHGRVDPPKIFDLRHQTLIHQFERRRSPVRGFLGGRIDLIPHQFSVVSEVTALARPRVLLADEVGLGKTIEACLVLHRLLVTRRAERVLIIVPEPLLVQWFVELLRRFNLRFVIADESWCVAAQGAEASVNPFGEEQWILTSLSHLTNQAQRSHQAADAGWDLVIVDEAHHLDWTPDSVSPEYLAVERIAGKTDGLLLLTATPEQLGEAGHFARLRLLDPKRFFDFESYKNEAAGYRKLAGVVDQLLTANPLDPTDSETLACWLERERDYDRTRFEAAIQGDTRARSEVIGDLLDRHGTGRMMFRNTRADRRGFPQRRVSCVRLELPSGVSDDGGPGGANDGAVADPRILWLATLLRSLAETEKVVLICHSQARVEAIEAALRREINVLMAPFHDGMPLVQRDRNAAWFADREGARILLCSEIGSEGRNFQFAHHLVLFDLPMEPELVEQRIGRLDRIGQTSDIHIYVPYVAGTSQETLARWYDEGLDAFSRTLRGGHMLGQQFAEPLSRILATAPPDPKQLDSLVRHTRTARTRLEHQLARGRDRLLEINSFKEDTARRVIERIRAHDEDKAVDAFMLGMWDHFGIHVEEIEKRTFKLGSGGVFADLFPGLNPEGALMTSLRSRALAREDVGFLTWDHPMVGGAMDMLLGSEEGTASFARWPADDSRDLLLETVSIIEPVAPPRLHADRFLPPTPVRVLVNHEMADLTGHVSATELSRFLTGGSVHDWIEKPEVRDRLLPAMLERSRELARARGESRVEDAIREMRRVLGHECDRLRSLKRVNKLITHSDIDEIEGTATELEEAFRGARIRLDSVRLIWKGPDGAGQDGSSRATAMTA